MLQHLVSIWKRLINICLVFKDIFGQSIVLTKDVDLESDKYIDLQNQSNVSRIYNLESKIYSGDSNRGQHEVSTQITILK